MEAPEFLYHKAARGSVKLILSRGLSPRIPVEWKYLIPSKYRNKSIVWLKENFVRGNIIVDTSSIDLARLHKIRLRDKSVSWWFYVGKIPPEALEV